MATARGRGEPATDGRARRSERSRRAIVDALFELVGAGELQPTAHQVAARAGVGLRTVFRHFADMETLFAEMDRRLRAEMEPLLEQAPAQGEVEGRVRALVAQRASLFERIAPYKRSADLQRPRSAFLREGHRRMVRELRASLLRALPELRAAPPDVADALELATSFEAWDRLRSDQRLGPRRAREATTALALALAGALVGRGRP